MRNVQCPKLKEARSLADCLGQLGHEGANRANSYALTAGIATGFCQGNIGKGANHGLYPAKSKIKCAHAVLITYPHAFATKNA